MQNLAMIEELLQTPPIPYEPAKHSLKAWAMFCLRDRGFKVVYAEKGDFAIESRNGEKTRFRVTQDSSNLDRSSVVWIVHNPTTNQISVIAPET